MDKLKKNVTQLKRAPLISRLSFGAAGVITVAAVIAILAAAIFNQCLLAILIGVSGLALLKGLDRCTPTHEGIDKLEAAINSDIELTDAWGNKLKARIERNNLTSTQKAAIVKALNFFRSEYLVILKSIEH